MKILIVFLAFFFSSIVNAQDQFIGQDFRVSLKPSGNRALLTFDLADGAKIYWRNPGELGMATKFSFNQEAQVFWPYPQLDDSSYVYKDKVDFVIKPENENLSVKVNFTICSKTCDNHEITLDAKLDLQEAETEELIQAMRKLPKANDSDGLKVLSVTQEEIDNQHWLNVKFTSNFDVKFPKIFLDLPQYVSFDPAKFELSDGIDGQLIRIPFTLLDNKQNINQIYLNLVDDKANAIEYEFKNLHEVDYSFLLIIFYALLGGLILNIMPCVLPILALKALQLIKLSGREASIIRKSFIAQSVGIIFSFIAVALITYAMQQLGKQVGFGLQFQQPLYLITMVIILSLIAINLIENIDLKIRMPEFLTKIFTSNRQDIIGFFLSGVLVTMLAIPCTAPFITIAVGFALTADLFKMLIIFLSIGVGMAMPYIIFAIYPNAAKLLPKGGEWMNKFKKILGILVFVTVIWLIYVVSSQLGNKAAIVLFFLIVLMKFILTDKKVFDSKLKASLTLILAFLCYFMPYHLYEEKQMEEVMAEDVWRSYRPDQISTLTDKGHIVILDVTASWCATCNINKATTLNNTSVMEFMKKREIIGMRADISAGNNPSISTLMRMYNHYGVPMNIIYSKKFPQGLVLPTLLTPNILIREFKKAG
jgi:suppressor for copper-sensitivity B